MDNTETIRQRIDDLHLGDLPWGATISVYTTKNHPVLPIITVRSRAWDETGDRYVINTLGAANGQLLDSDALRLHMELILDRLDAERQRRVTAGLPV